MCAHGGRRLGRCRSRAEDGIRVARSVGMMREARRVRAACRRLGESCEGHAMESQSAPRLERLFDRQASELVAERDRVRRRLDEHPRAQTLLECAGVFTG
jgi:hypothetical protein